MKTPPRPTLACLDLAGLKRETEIVGYPILPLVRQLAAACSRDAGGYVHWGATTQDIMDTAVVLQLRAGVRTDRGRPERHLDSLETLARRYRDTPMAGRTHLQHALPVTFGYNRPRWWRAPLTRLRERLAQMRPRVLVGQFGGAAGTLASLGDQGLAVRAALMRRTQARRTRHHLARGTRYSGRIRFVSLGLLYRLTRRRLRAT